MPLRRGRAVGVAVVLLGLLAAHGLPAAAQTAGRVVDPLTERRLMLDVMDALEARDCRKVTVALNKGVASGSPVLLLMAGTMFEEGLCLKPDWDRALAFYLRADQAGHPPSRMKLVAGFAHDGRDVAAALWWAQQAETLPLPPECRVPDWLTLSPDAFVLTLQRWLPARLQGCVYVAGVLATVVGDLQYPPLAWKYHLAGDVGMRFVPAESRFEWRTVDIEAVPMPGVVTGEELRDRGSLAARKSFEAFLRESGERALRRYDKPPAIDPAWRLDTSFTFRIVYQ